MSWGGLWEKEGTGVQGDVGRVTVREGQGRETQWTRGKQDYDEG